MAAVDHLARGPMLYDSVAIIGSLDVVFGEIDDEYWSLIANNQPSSFKFSKKMKPRLSVS